jgi:ankyrin repeat protein
MIKPTDIDEVVWQMITAAAEGDTATLQRLLADDPSRSREVYWYTPPIHFAAREGHLEAVRLLLDAGADCEWNAYYGVDLIEMARERGHEDVAQLLEQTRERRGRIAAAGTREDHPVHLAAENDDVRRVRELLEADTTLIEIGDSTGGTPLHRAVAASARNVVKLLLDRGANIHAIHGTGRGAGCGFWSQDIQAIDIAIWGLPRRRRRLPQWRLGLYWLRYMLWRRFTKPGLQPCDPKTARLLLSRGAAHDLTIASALGDFDRVKEILDKDPARITDLRPNGRRPLRAAVEFHHDNIARLLLERGADPTWRELDAERGGALHSAARDGNLQMVELLLAHGADPNSGVESSGNAVFIAKTPEIRDLLRRHGGALEPYDLVWKNEDDEVVRLLKENPGAADLGCGTIFTAVVTLGKRDLLKRLLDLGIRVPRVVTGCQTYLLEHPDMLQALLDSGMHPDTHNWQEQTMLHWLCGPDPEGNAVDLNTQRAEMLLKAGALINARDNQYSSTPLAWAARNNNPGMVKFLLAHGAPTSLPDDKPWATPLAWATRRGHAEIVSTLQGK